MTSTTSKTADTPAAAPAPARHAPVSVQVRNARLKYNGVSLFEGLDVTLEAGLFTCLLGPSGIGKSSLLRLIAGLGPVLAPLPVSASDRQPLAGRIAYMDQRDLLLPWLSVLANVTLGSRLRGQPADTNRARGLLDSLGLGDRLDDRPDSLSGGMRQRVALARTLMEACPVILMDEPFGALDALTRLRLQELAADRLAGHTVLLVTHDPMEALRLGHRVHVMAGQPAQLDEALVVPGTPPRDPTAETLVALYRDLLRRLRAAALMPDVPAPRSGVAHQ